MACSFIFVPLTMPECARGEWTIVGSDPAMITRIAVLLALASAVLPSPSVAASRDEAKSQVEFGIGVAERGLWREAIYRWEKAVELDPTYPAAFNDLAIGYEHEGQFDK